MNYLIEKKLPGMEELLADFPLSMEDYVRIKKDRQAIARILQGKDKRLIMIIGPCSAWPSSAVLEYAARLKKIAHKIRDKIKVILRVYIQKPRTLIGWPGALYQPDPFAPPDIIKGIKYTREMMVNIIKLGLPIASEVLFTQYRQGFLELLSWAAIGARSSENTEHRILASALPMPCGLKNPTHGNLLSAINSVYAAQQPHVTLLEETQIKTYGNPFAHLVLRGGNHKPNYSLANLRLINQNFTKTNIKNPSIIIDVNHDNNFFRKHKSYTNQPNIIFSLLKKLAKEAALKKLVKGFMVESFLQNGQQKIAGDDVLKLNMQGLSITDSCIGWEETKHLLQTLANCL